MHMYPGMKVKETLENTKKIFSGKDKSILCGFSKNISVLEKKGCLWTWAKQTW